MLTDDGKHLYVSWDEYHMLIERLALKIHASGWAFDQILCLARGGMRPGDVLSRVFDKPLAIMSTSSYRAEAGTIQGRLDLAKYITLPKGELAGRVLLVDDLADSGVTLRAVVDRLRGMPSISELRSAVIWTKGVSSYTPDYFVEMLPTSPWIRTTASPIATRRPAHASSPCGSIPSSSNSIRKRRPSTLLSPASCANASSEPRDTAETVPSTPRSAPAPGSSTRTSRSERPACSDSASAKVPLTRRPATGRP